MTRNYPHYLAVPFHIGDDGRTARVEGLPDHVRDELMQLVLTNLGERPFLPEFGTNVRRLVFENLGDITETLTKSTVANALSRWLGERITVENLRVGSDDSRLTVEIQYRIAGTEDSRTLRFQRART